KCKDIAFELGKRYVNTDNSQKKNIFYNRFKFYSSIADMIGKVNFSDKTVSIVEIKPLTKVVYFNGEFVCDKFEVVKILSFYDLKNRKYKSNITKNEIKFNANGKVEKITYSNGLEKK